jgi:drug/metabolite transporter (DMT)-like permease
MQLLVGPGRMSRLGADGLLLTTALLWGVTFVAQKYAAATMPAVAFVAARFAVSAVALAPFALWEFRRKSHAPGRDEWRLALAVGFTLFLGTSLQQAGIETTSATNAGFLTACYVVLTPFVVWALSGARPRVIVLAAAFVSLIGAWLLASGAALGAPNIGDALVLLADLAWATGIALTPIFLARSGRPLLLAFVQYAACAGLAALWSFVFETVPAGALAATAPAILFSGIISGALAYTIQIFAQAHTPPAETALILSLESVFAAFAGSILLGERLTALGAVGCALILIGAIAVEAGPAVARLADPASVKARRPRGP